MIPVYVGSHERFARVEPVCAHAILKHAAADVLITFLRPDRFGYADSGCTGFTNMRWVVPHLTTGVAIYIDVDMLLLADIGELLQYQVPNRYACLADGSSEVMVMDCSAKLPEADIRKGNKWALQRAAPLTPVIPDCWNVKDTLRDDAKLLHFTDLKAQPWFYEHPNKQAADLWFRYESDSKRRMGVH